MKNKTIGKIAVDLGMTALLILLMAFELIGRTAHEWIGTAMFALFIFHHILNWRWITSLFQGRYTHYRVLQIVSAGLVFLTMMGSMISAILISREVFAFLPISGGRSFGRVLHMICAYWGFLLLSFHLGIHWNMILSMADRLPRGKLKLREQLLRLSGSLIAAYGVYALLRRDILRYLFLQTRFVFFDFEEPLVLFILDYLAVMGLFIFMGNSAAAAVRKWDQHARNRARQMETSVVPDSRMQ